MTTEALKLEQAKQPHRAWWLIRLVTPVVIIGLLWNLADGPGALALLGEAKWIYLLLALVAVNLQTLASAWRWHRVAARLGQSIPPSHAIAEYYLSQLINQSLPGGVLGDVGRAVRARHEAGLGIAAKAVIIERLAGQIAMFSLLAIGIAWALLTPGGLAFDLDPSHVFGAVVALFAISALVWLAVHLTRKRWSPQFGASLSQALITEGAWIEQSLFGALIVALNLMSFTLCALATGTVLGAEAIMVLVPLILCAMLIPATIAGWGFREGAAVALFPLAGATAAAGFAASLAFGLVILAASLPGLLVLLRQPRKPR